MLSVLDIFFFATLLPYYAGIFQVLKRCVPALSLSALFLVLNFIFVVVPGYFNYRGGILYDATAEIDVTAYVLYYLQALIPPLAVYASWRASGPPVLRVKRRSGIMPIYTVALLAVVAYDIVYIVANASQIPLVSVFTGNFDAVAFLRSELTHGVADSDLPWYFAYYRIFTKDLMFVLSIPLFLFTPFWRSVPKALGFFALVFLLLMHVEKAYLLFLFAALYLAQSDFRPPSLKTVMGMAGGVIFLTIIVTYFLFADSLSDTFVYLPTRLSGQTGYVVPQLQEFQQYGFLGLRGIRLGIFDRIFGIDYVDIPALTFSSVHSDLAQAGISGSSAGSSMAELYMIAGYLSPLIYFIAIYLLAQLDKNLRVFATTFRGASNFEARLGRGFYIYFVCFYALEPVTSIFGVFSPVTVFQPALLLTVLLFIIFFQVNVRGRSHSAAVTR